ncbi:MAG: bifunctional 3,4-dihydroxy-2-butanone-4-phosphate synthase/GTP cyclohydrolase II [Bdellovibrionota bacterium]
MKISNFERIDRALEDFKNGKMVIVVDDDNRENEGDLVLAAEHATPENINFMITHARGLVCLTLDSKKVDELGLPLMVQNNQAPFQTAFTISIEAREGVTTGISAFDRAKTIQTAIKETASNRDLVVPGHVFPLRSVDGGVLVRAGHTEASVDMARLAGLKPAGVICEILNEDGTMARVPDLEKFAEKYDLPLISIADLIEYRLHRDKSLVTELASSELPTKHGVMKIRVFESQVDGREHVALVVGDPSRFSKEPTLVRVHSECLTGDVFGSLRCDCGNQLDKALDIICEKGQGVLLYLRQEGRGIGLLNKIKAYAFQDQGLDTVEANAALGLPPDLRHYGIGAQILRNLGLKNIVILSNNPRKIVGIESYGLTVVDRMPLEGFVKKENKRYLEAKKNKLGHLLS